MKIAIDCRYIGKSGIGRACKGILDALDFSQNEYYLIGDSRKLSGYTNAHIIEDNTDPFSAKGLFSFDKKLNKICDVFFVPNFIIPMGVKLPVYSIMHDLMFLDVKELTDGFVDKSIKKFLLKRGVRKSKKVFCVSRFTLNRCKHYYPKYADKFTVNYIGAVQIDDSLLPAAIEKENNLVFVGNVKPHKGIRTLIDAYKLLPVGQFRLKIIGEKDNFITGMDTADLECEGVSFTGRLSDKKMFEEVAKAKFLIQPSKYEGFGLPPFEALYLGTKPIISDIEVFKEVYEGMDVAYFKVGDAESLKDAILSADSGVKDCREAIKSKYNFKNTAGNILAEMNKGVKGRA